MCSDMAMVQSQWYHFGMGAPPILEPILVVGLGPVHWGLRIWVLTHHMKSPPKNHPWVTRAGADAVALLHRGAVLWPGAG